mmetsp:Transcript_31074/g.30526  ORF Transcript_31074/g.30526 Transcript_31074/m.30526 type:complete len:137 (+) Transcript_31074:712-1122(+)
MKAEFDDLYLRKTDLIKKSSSTNLNFASNLMEEVNKQIEKLKQAVEEKVDLEEYEGFVQKVQSLVQGERASGLSTPNEDLVHYLNKHSSNMSLNKDKSPNLSRRDSRDEKEEEGKSTMDVLNEKKASKGSKTVRHK